MGYQQRPAVHMAQATVVCGRAGSFIVCEIIADRESSAPSALPAPASASVPDDTTTREDGVIEVALNGGRTLRVCACRGRTACPG